MGGGGLGGASLISGNFFICRTFHWVFLLQYHALKRSGAQKFKKKLCDISKNMFMTIANSFWTSKFILRACPLQCRALKRARTKIVEKSCLTYLNICISFLASKFILSARALHRIRFVTQLFFTIFVRLRALKPKIVALVQAITF